MVRLLLLALASLAVTTEATASAYRYSLPGSPLWPRKFHWTLLKVSVEGEIVLRGEDGYNLTGLYNERSNTPQPAAIAYPKTTKDVQLLVLFAQATQMRISVLSTGHNNDLRNTADNSLMLNMKYFNQLSVNTKARTVTVGPAIIFSELVAAVKTATNGQLVPLTGNSPSVGVWGWSVGGGIGLLTKIYGLGADAIVSATVVTATGTVVTATATNEHKDLLWALKGGAGSSFGVGLSLTVKLFPAPGTFHMFSGMYVLSDAVTDQFSAHVGQLGNNAGGFYFLVTPGLLYLIGYCIGGSCEAALAGFEALPGCFVVPGTSTCARYSYPDQQGFLENFVTAGKFPGRHQWVVGGTKAEDLAEQYKLIGAWYLRQEEVTFSKQCYGSTVLGGVSTGMDPNGALTAIAPGFRQSLQYMTCIAFWGDDVSVADQRKIIDSLEELERDALAPYSPGEWVYWNEAHHNFEGDSWHRRYWGSEKTYNKLLAIKLRYDPTNFVTCFHCVGWNFDKTVDPDICPSNCSCSNTPQGTCAMFADDNCN